jgi:riboflavin biosynthesis pyrimidine reductase
VDIVWRTAMSIDGRLASADESLSFLESIERREEALADFPSFLASIDAVILGAGTLRWLIRGGHGWPHDDLPTWLVSRDGELRAKVGVTRAPFVRFEGDVRELVAAIARSGARRVWLSGGGRIAGQLLAIDAVDEIAVTIAPVVLGAGPLLFGEGAMPEKRFALVGCERFAGNAVRATWRRR